MAGDRGRKTENRGQIDNREQRAEDREQKSEDRSENTVIRYLLVVIGLKGMKARQNQTVTERRTEK